MKKIFISILFASFFVLNITHAQSCKSGESQAGCEARLREEQKKLEEEVKKLEGDIKKEDQNQKNLSGEITKLSSEINSTNSKIKKKNSLISNLASQIGSRQERIGFLSDKLAREKESLEKIIRKRRELSELTLFEYILSLKNISLFFEDHSHFSMIQDSHSKSFKKIESLQEELGVEKKTLEGKKKEQADARYSLTLEKGKIETQKKDRDTALKLSENKEAGLAELKKLREEEIKKIRSALIQFQGSGVTSRSISFGEAYDYAKNTEKKTGVRAAFIMAIMQQETNFGNNVGGCYLTKKPVGLVNGSYQSDGVYIKSGNPSKKNMIPSHFDAFVRITSRLGRDWKKTPISCALVRSNGTLYGYGGAMGYTQFIPGTWELVAKRVQSYLGVAVANPWNPRDAVMATGIFLQDRGAAKGGYTAEYNAACRYYGACSTYASSVMGKAANIQKQINTIES